MFHGSGGDVGQQRLRVDALKGCDPSQLLGGLSNVVEGREDQGGQPRRGLWPGGAGPRGHGTGTQGGELMVEKLDLRPGLARGRVLPRDDWRMRAA